MERDMKAHIRNMMTQKRNSLSDEQRRISSESACLSAQKWLESRSAESFMVYAPFRSELDLTLLVEWGWKSGRAVIVPRCKAEDRTMTLHYLRSWDELVPGAYGIMEPHSAASPPINDFVPDVVFVPGLAFDRAGGRLGYGGGYYDRFAEAQLACSEAAERTSLWIGAAFEIQLIDDVPIEKHDLQIDGLLTEQGIYMV